MKRKGRPEKISPSELSLLRKLALERPLATLDELVKAFQTRTGLQVHSATLRKALLAAGMTRAKPPARQPAAGDNPSSQRYGYQDRHRPPESAEHYPSSLTDAEWDLVQDLFEREEQAWRSCQNSAPHLGRCLLLCGAYRLRMATVAPKDFPHWDNVYKTFRRWSAQGRFEAMRDRLRQMWRVREERDAMPNAAVLDAQSTRSSPQGGPSG